MVSHCLRIDSLIAKLGWLEFNETRSGPGCRFVTTSSRKSEIPGHQQFESRRIHDGPSWQSADAVPAKTAWYVMLQA